MNERPLAAPAESGLDHGDIVTIEGCFNRPATRSLAWWAMLVFGPEFACRHLGRAFRRKRTDPFYHIPHTRRALLEPRELQKYRIQGQ